MLVYVHTPLSLSVCMYMCVCACVCACVFPHACMCSCAYMRFCVYLCSIVDKYTKNRTKMHMDLYCLCVLCTVTEENEVSAGIIWC